MGKELKKRTLSSVVFLILVVGSILPGAYYYLPVFSFFAFIALQEIFAIFQKQGYTPRKKIALPIGLLAFCLAFFVAKQTLPSATLLIPFLLFLSICIIELYHPQKDPLLNLSATVFGIVYVIIPFSCLHFIAFSGLNQNQYTYKYLLAMFSIIWVNDAGAYLIGSAIGKRKLFERISPGKTLEGTLGGGISALIAGFVISLYINDLSVISWILFSLIVVFGSTYGDLFESLLKRQTGIKDSGRIMPGHGGLLDRFDSTFFVAPATLLYLKIIEYFF